MNETLETLQAAMNALRSYEHGNCGPCLASKIADKCKATIDKLESERAEQQKQEPGFPHCPSCGSSAWFCTVCATPPQDAQNAKRYRWLRSPEAAVAEICNCVTPKEDGFVFMEGAQLDAAIDEAMREKGG